MEKKGKMNLLTKFTKHQLNMYWVNLWFNLKIKFKI